VAPWDLHRVVHLHRRAGFAASWEEIERDLKDGPGPSIDRLLAGQVRSRRVPDDFESIAALLAEGAGDDSKRLAAWWIYRMVSGADPLGERLVAVSDSVGLHPAMGEAGKLLESQRLTLFQGVAYPNPNRSHFESMAIWQTARLDPRRPAEIGWLGQTLDGDVKPRAHSLPGPGPLGDHPAAAGDPLAPGPDIGRGHVAAGRESAGRRT
jgi:uncharacterized protein (DUF1501 family)